MTAEEISEIAIDSSCKYYDYLNDNDRGVQEVDVFELEHLDERNNIFRLRLSAKLFDTEAIFFKNLRNNKKYSTDVIKIIEYDNDRNILLVRPTEEVREDFLGITSNYIKVIFDLKFLVERVKAWFELNGAKLALPKQVSKFATKITGCDKTGS